MCVCVCVCVCVSVLCWCIGECVRVHVCVHTSSDMPACTSVFIYNVGGREGSQGELKLPLLSTDPLVEC